MKILVYFCVQILFIAFLFTVCCAETGEKGPKRSRSLNSAGLIPFPRIGRGGDLTWEIESAYPKIGRTWINDVPAMEAPGSKRNGPKTVSTGLWFGPRLGRLQKRGGLYMHEPWNYVLLGGVDKKSRSGQVIIPFMRTGRRGFRIPSGGNMEPKPGHIIHPQIRVGRGGDLAWQSDESDIPMYRQTKFTPRLGRESEEVEDYNEESEQPTEQAA